MWGGEAVEREREREGGGRCSGKVVASAGGDVS